MPTALLRIRLLAASAAAAACAMALGSPPRPAKVVIVIEENHAYTQVIGSPSAPYLNSLAAQGVLFNNFYGVTHPSQPNYLQLFSGASQGVTNDTVPAAGTPFTTANLAAELRAMGFTFIGYSEDLPALGSTVGSSGYYMRKHNPWVNWQNTPQGANQLPTDVNRPFTDFPADFSLLPDVSVVVPNQLNDMHDGTIAQADAWLVAHIKPFADWAMINNGLLIITFDEDNSAARNRIPTVFYGPMALRAQNDATWTLHSLLRTVEDMYGTGHAGISAQSRPIAGVFRSDPLVQTLTFRQGVDGYSGAADTYIEQAAPDAAHDAETRAVIDGSPLSQGLVRFADVVGAGLGQVPPGARIVAAKLSLLTGPSSATSDSTANTMAIHPMLVAWPATPTWNTLVGGVSTNGIEAATAEEFHLLPNVLNAWAIFDVTTSVQAWANGTAANHGWVIVPTGTDGWRLVTSESTVPGDRPVLEVTFEIGPPCAADFNHDGFVDPLDYNQYINDFEAGFLSADFNGDGFLDPLDYNAFLNAFEAPCP